nr:hypothetical protein [Candidatus Sigynarchaeota archaeon]
EPITRENVKDELATPVSCIAPASVPEPARGRRLKSWNDDFDEPALGLAKRRRFKSWDDAINELAPGTSSAKLWVMQDDTTRTKSWDGGTDRLAPGVPSAKSWVVQEDTAQAKFDDDSTGGLAPDVPSTKPLMAILHCKPCLPDSVQDKEIVRHTERILSCPICGARINVHDVADGLLYSCKKCKKEMEIEIECPKCFGKIMHNQISFASPGSHGIKCPTCWEAVQM